MQFFTPEQPKIAIIGLGYVGLPLAVEFGNILPTIGFDINLKRLDELKSGEDKTLEVTPDQLKNSQFLQFTASIEEIKSCNTFIVTVPTPVDKHNRPDLTPLYKASETVGKALSKGDVVIYESTVYPGVTEDECIPVLEKTSGLVYNVDFFAGYSPERINPGDKEHTVTKIRKVTSGSTPEVADYVDALYGRIIKAGTFKASSIKVAEAAKVIENSQRDINIAFVNELAKIFNRLGIDTQDVLDAAGTKWNFLPFRPGLVGGHCIGVDPYYLAQKAQEAGYHPEIILAGRRLNDGMGNYIATELISSLVNKDLKVRGAKTLICGFTFKENCPDVRNTRVIDVVTTLQRFGMDITIFDPWANPEEVFHEYKLNIVNTISDSVHFDVLVLAVSHREFLAIDFEAFKAKGTFIFDIKSFLPKGVADLRL